MRFIDLFSGIGGFRLALEDLGFECLAFCEIDQYAVDVYTENFDIKPHESYYKDILQIIINKPRKQDVDIITAGFPCQPFSIGGKRKAEDDQRCLYTELLQVINYYKPRFFLFENVPGLLSVNNGETYKRMIRQIIDIGYNVRSNLFNSYLFGVPQSRQRLYIVGFKDFAESVKYNFPANIATTKTLKDFLQDITQENENEFYKGMKLFLSAKAVEGIYRRKKSQITDDYAKRIGTITTRTGSSLRQVVRVNKGKFSQGQRIYDPNHCSITISALGGGQGAKTGLYLTDHGIRRLSVRECLRLQGFPDSFKIPAHISDNQAYKQIGNAVTVPAIKDIAECLFDIE